jgi:hypothetical protein
MNPADKKLHERLTRHAERFELAAATQTIEAIAVVGSFEPDDLPSFLLDIRSDEMSLLGVAFAPTKPPKGGGVFLHGKGRSQLRDLAGAVMLDVDQLRPTRASKRVARRLASMGREDGLARWLIFVFELAWDQTAPTLTATKQNWWRHSMFPWNPELSPPNDPLAAGLLALENRKFGHAPYPASWSRFVSRLSPRNFFLASAEAIRWLLENPVQVKTQADRVNDRMPMYVKKAGLSFEWVCGEYPELVPVDPKHGCCTEAQYRKIKNGGCPAYEGANGPVPDFDTWRRYVREYVKKSSGSSPKDRTIDTKPASVVNQNQL